jgi:Cd2+/Zn2+-exporting ATPase
MSPSDADDGSGPPDERTVTARLSVPDMDCASCAGKVETSLRRVDGITALETMPTTGRVVVTYDPTRTTEGALVAAIEGAGYEVVDRPGADASDAGRGGQVEARFSVPNMDCASCAEKVGAGLDGVDGVTAYDTRPTTGQVVVRYDPARTTEGALVAAIEGVGYEVVDRDGDGTGVDTDAHGSANGGVWRSRRALETGVSAVFLAGGLLFEFVLGTNPLVTTVLGGSLFVADALFLVAVAVGGRAILRNGYYSARGLNLDIDFLMSVAILGALAASLAFGEGLYFEAATLAVLFSVAELLERASMDRARDSLQELIDLSPDEATIRRDGEMVRVPVEDVSVGEVVVIKPGEKVPMDGEVLDGESAVNQAPITGESVPVGKTVGDEVFAGSINEAGYLEVQVTSAAGEDTLSRIVEMVEDAQANRTEREQFVERFAAYYTPAVVAFAVLVTLGSPALLGVTVSEAVVYGLTLLVLACPCAFVISTPVSVVSGVTSAAKNGVLVKGGSHLEAMGAVDVVAFDKTGTLTKGELTVTDVIALNGSTEEDVLRCARGLEKRSEHPIGQAIVGRAEAREVGDRSVSAFESITGKGVRATLDGTPHYAGKPGLFEELGFDLSHVHATTDGGQVTRTSRQLCERHDCLDLLSETVPELQSEGKTVVLVGTEDELEGLIAVADEVRPEARWAVERLRDLGVERTVMLTGDNERTAAAIAREVGVDDYRAELLPDDKVRTVEELVAEYEGGVRERRSWARRTRSGGVAMVGDGINDAPAMATATVGIAMGAAGTDTALETADVALMADDLAKLPYLYDLSGRANGVIRQNVAASLLVKAGLALAVPFGYVPIWLAVLAGDAGMTIGVTGNAMRLSRVRAEAPAESGTEP